jgi:hypothetical protein
MTDTTYISEGNAKTECFSFDLPARDTCPGRTEFCASKCYAAKLSSAYPNVGRKYERNKAFAESANFIRHMIANIPYGRDFRIHVSGDFYSWQYVQAWVEIVKARRDVRFYAYTRSWRDSVIWFDLQKLGAFSNMTLNLSCDKETGIPDCENAQDYRWCYMTDNDEGPFWLRSNDIVFRTNHNARQGNHQWKRNKAVKNGQDPDAIAPLLHRIADAIVCPFERGKDMPANFSCARCQLCVRKPKTQGVPECNSSS